jgi:undecaprenyl-diphosphatase
VTRRRETTRAAAAVAAAGFLVFLAYALVIGRGNAMTPGDHLFHTLARDLYSSAGKEVAEAITTLGALPVVLLVTALTAVVLAVRGRPTEAIAIVAGLAILFVAVHVAKTVVDRPRPPDRLTATTGQAYPSGHAAYSTLYVAIALAAARGTATRRAALVAAGIALAAAIGITRVYLRVHWWSDVVGGWALGVAVFAGAALTVDAVRHNWSSDDGGD